MPKRKRVLQNARKKKIFPSFFHFLFFLFVILPMKNAKSFCFFCLFKKALHDFSMVLHTELSRVRRVYSLRLVPFTWHIRSKNKITTQRNCERELAVKIRVHLIFSRYLTVPSAVLHKKKSQNKNGTHQSKKRTHPFALKKKKILFYKCPTGSQYDQQSRFLDVIVLCMLSWAVRKKKKSWTCVRMFLRRPCQLYT